MLHIFRLKSTTRKKEHEMQVVFAKTRLIHFSRMLRFILVRFILFLHSKTNDWFLYETLHIVFAEQSKWLVSRWNAALGWNRLTDFWMLCRRLIGSYSINFSIVLFYRPSFDGYFASRSGTIELRHKGQILKADAEKIGEIQRHLDHMIDLLRDIDILRMVSRWIKKL